MPCPAHKTSRVQHQHAGVLHYLVRVMLTRVRLLPQGVCGAPCACSGSRPCVGLQLTLCFWLCAGAAACAQRP